MTWRHASSIKPVEIGSACRQVFSVFHAAAIGLQVVCDSSELPLIAGRRNRYSCYQPLFRSALLLPPESEHYFNEARDSIISAVAAAERGTRITNHLPEKLLGYFDRFGRNLADGEAIELESDKIQQPARLTKESRRKLVLASSSKHYTDETSVYGLVHEFDQQTNTFQLTLPSGPILSRIPVESQHYDAVLDASSGFRHQQRIRINGVGRFDLSDKLLELISVEHVIPLDRLDVIVRVDELKLLKRSWLDGKGEAIDARQLNWVVHAFRNYYPDDAKLPYLLPTPEGNLLAEWALDGNSVTLEIDLDSLAGDWHSLTLADKQRRIKTVRFECPG